MKQQLELRECRARGYFCPIESPRTAQNFAQSPALVAAWTFLPIAMSPKKALESLFKALAETLVRQAFKFVRQWKTLSPKPIAKASLQRLSVERPSTLQEFHAGVRTGPRRAPA